MNSYSTYTMDNIRFCTQWEPMLHKQSTGCGLQVTAEAISSGEFHEEDDEQPIMKDTHHSLERRLFQP